MKKIFAFPIVALALAGCIKTDNTVEVKPIEIKMTLEVKLDQSLDQAFEGPVANPQEERAQCRERMKARRPSLNEYKKSGIIAETTRGYLRVANIESPDSDNAAKLVAAENSDRKIIYKYVAEKDGTTVDYVGRVWAKKQAERDASRNTKTAE